MALVTNCEITEIFILKFYETGYRHLFTLVLLLTAGLMCKPMRVERTKSILHYFMTYFYVDKVIRFVWKH
jgi:hypothetical protein